MFRLRPLFLFLSCVSCSHSLFSSCISCPRSLFPAPILYFLSPLPVSCPHPVLPVPAPCFHPVFPVLSLCLPVLACFLPFLYLFSLCFLPFFFFPALTLFLPLSVPPARRCFPPFSLRFGSVLCFPFPSPDPLAGARRNGTGPPRSTASTPHIPHLQRPGSVPLPLPLHMRYGSLTRKP